MTCKQFLSIIQPFSRSAYCLSSLTVFKVLFFIKGFLWFNVYEYGVALNKLLDLAIVFFYLFEQYRHRTLKFNRRFIVVVIFSMLWLFHLSLTAFLEAARLGYIPTLFYRNHMVAGAYAVRVQHLIYGPFLGVIKKIIKTLLYIYLCFVMTELFIGDKNNRLLKLFTWGNMIALPFIFISLYGRPLFGGGIRFSPEIVPGIRVHPNTVGLLFLFSFFANMLVSFREKVKIIKVCHVFYCVMAICFILLAGARSCAVCVSVASIFLFLTVWRKHLFSLIAVLLIFSIVLSISLNFVISSGMLKENPILKRMSFETAEKDKGSGRLDAWLDYYKYTTLKQLIIGVGPLATTSTIFYKKFPLRSWSGFIEHPSNTYIYILLTYGIAGFIIFMLFICKIFMCFRFNLKHDKNITCYIDMGMLLGYCAFQLTAYAQIVEFNGISIFWIYMISRALKH